MPKSGLQAGSLLGPDLSLLGLVNAGVTTYAMAALNTGWCVRFIAETTDDVSAIRVRWSSVTAAGTVQFRIETIDATTGKPSGTLYDANAVINVTPVAGTQVYTFATLPTTGLVVGNMYAIVALTTVAGTTQTLASHVASTVVAKYPCILLTAADGTVRANFAEVGGSMAVVCIVSESSIERYANQTLPYYAFTVNPVFGANTWVASKITINFPVIIAGIRFVQTKTGTAAGDLRIRILDINGNVVAGSTVSIDKDALLTGSTARGHLITFAAVITLSPGVYRIVFDSANSVDSSNCFRPSSVSFLDGDDISSNYRLSTSANGGSTWTDSTADQLCTWLMVDNLAERGLSVQPKTLPDTYTTYLN